MGWSNRVTGQRNPSAAACKTVSLFGLNLWRVTPNDCPSLRGCNDLGKASRHGVTIIVPSLDVVADGGVDTLCVVKVCTAHQENSSKPFRVTIHEIFLEKQTGTIMSPPPGKNNTVWAERQN